MSAYRSARPGDRLNRGDLSCAAQWMLEGSHLPGVMPKNRSRLRLRRCHRRQLPHTGVSARLGPRAFPYQHEPPPKNLPQKPTSPTHQHRRPPFAFDPTRPLSLRGRNGSSCPIPVIPGVPPGPAQVGGTCPWHPGFPSSAIRSLNGPSSSLPRFRA